MSILKILNGRMNRKQYVKYYFALVATVIAGGLAGMVIAHGNEMAYQSVVYSIAIFAGLATFVLDARRFHDMGKATKWALIPLAISTVNIIPAISNTGMSYVLTLAGSIIFLYLCFVKGDDGVNQYGAAC